eukprot:5666278-Prorocentrum_lima.AAC.1
MLCQGVLEKSSCGAGGALGVILAMLVHQVSSRRSSRLRLSPPQGPHRSQGAGTAQAHGEKHVPK